MTIETSTAYRARCPDCPWRGHLHETAEAAWRELSRHQQSVLAAAQKAIRDATP